MRWLPSTFRSALRVWTRRPGLAVTATLVLALGVGATTAMFSVIKAVLLERDPWPDADRLVRIYAIAPADRANAATAGRWNRMP